MDPILENEFLELLRSDKVKIRNLFRPIETLDSFPRKIAKIKCKAQRYNIYLRQGGICHYCENRVFLRDFTLDHKVPKSKGGSSRNINLVGACSKCNHEKDSQTYNNFLNEKKKAVKNGPVLCSR